MTLTDRSICAKTVRIWGRVEFKLKILSRDQSWQVICGLSASGGDNSSLPTLFLADLVVPEEQEENEGN